MFFGLLKIVNILLNIIRIARPFGWTILKFGKVNATYGTINLLRKPSTRYGRSDTMWDGITRSTRTRYCGVLSIFSASVPYLISRRFYIACAVAHNIYDLFIRSHRFSHLKLRCLRCLRRLRPLTPTFTFSMEKKKNTIFLTPL